MESRNLKICIIGLILIFFLIFLVTNLKNKIFIQGGSLNNYDDCVKKIELKEVRGNSLFPLIKSGQQVKLLYDYYECHTIEKEDVVAYNYGGNSNPIIKIIKAIPGDKLEFKKNENDSFQIIINNKQLKTSEEQLYQIPESKSKIMELYAKSYPVLPKDTYLILGNQIAGTLDSTKFGLIHKNDILGKITLD